MRKLVIRVYVEGKVKKFTAPRFVSWDTFNKTMELNKMFNSNISNEELIPKCFSVMCSIFGHQFNEEQLQRGYAVKEILLKTDEAITYVMSTAELSRKGEVVPFESKSKRSVKTYFTRG